MDLMFHELATNAAKYGLFLGVAAEIVNFQERNSMSEENPRFAEVIGHAALRLWPDLPRDFQERLFEDAVANDESLRRQLALYLHEHHPRIAHPPKHTAFA